MFSLQQHEACQHGKVHVLQGFMVNTEKRADAEDKYLSSVVSFAFVMCAADYNTTRHCFI